MCYFQIWKDCRDAGVDNYYLVLERLQGFGSGGELLSDLDRLQRCGDGASNYLIRKEGRGVGGRITI